MKKQMANKHIFLGLQQKIHSRGKKHVDPERIKKEDNRDVFGKDEDIIYRQDLRCEIWDSALIDRKKQTGHWEYYLSPC